MGSIESPTTPLFGCYPELSAETRTVPVRIELPNPEERMKPAMYTDVLFRGGEDAPVTSVPGRNQTSRRDWLNVR